MGQTQEFEATANQLVSLTVAKSGDALGLTMVLDSASITTNAPTGVPDVSDAIGMKFSGDMAADGKVGKSAVSDKTGAPSTSQLAGNFRSFLPRLSVGAAKGATWTDSTSTTAKQNDADVTTTTTVSYTLAGDTTVNGATAWKITGVSTSKLEGKGNRMGTDYSLKGTVKGQSTSVVSSAGILIGETAESDSLLTVNVEAAGMTIPIAQKTSTKIERLP